LHPCLKLQSVGCLSANCTMMLHASTCLEELATRDELLDNYAGDADHCLAGTLRVPMMLMAKTVRSQHFSSKFCAV